MDPWGSNTCNEVSSTVDGPSEEAFDSNFCLGDNAFVQGKEKSVLNDNYSNKLGKIIFFVFFYVRNK